MAGLRSANDLARCALYDLLNVVHSSYAPFVRTSSWVDDVTQRAEGARRRIVRQLGAAGRTFARGIDAMHLRISSKSACIASSHSLVAEVVAELRASGIPIAFAHTSPDLGIDRGRNGARGGNQKLRKNRKTRRDGRVGQPPAPKPELREQKLKRASVELLASETSDPPTHPLE